MLGNEGILGEWVVKSIFIRLHFSLLLKCLLVSDGEPLDADPGICPIMVGCWARCFSLLEVVGASWVGRP